MGCLPFSLQWLTIPAFIPTLDFESVDCEVPDIDPDISIKDWQYVPLISSAAKSENFSVDLSVREPRPLSHDGHDGWQRQTEL